MVFPKMSGFLRIPIFDKKVKSFFLEVVKDTIKMREEHNIKRSDILGFLIEARKRQQSEEIVNDIEDASSSEAQDHPQEENIEHNLSDIDIAYLVSEFFSSGLETVSNAMCFVAYELANNQDVQKKLIEEIDEKRSLNNIPEYETAHMTYWDMVLAETLHDKWPIAVSTDRELLHEKPVHLGIGDIIIIPIYSLHHDPQFYFNPGKFDPEPFSPKS